MTTLYGIPNCDTVKKARKWLDSQSIDYTFHDFRKDGVSQSTIKEWAQSVGKDVLINKRSTTWKQLSDADKKHFEGDTLSAKALASVVANPTLIKRPVLNQNDSVLVGFNADLYKNLID
ncbi:MAG: ArsC family reductase [Agarilytica sp.]